MMNVSMVYDIVCFNSECHYAEVSMLNVIMMNVVNLSVMTHGINISLGQQFFVVKTSDYSSLPYES